MLAKLKWGSLHRSDTGAEFVDFSMLLDNNFYSKTNFSDNLKNMKMEQTD